MQSSCCLGMGSQLLAFLPPQPLVNGCFVKDWGLCPMHITASLKFSPRAQLSCPHACKTSAQLAGMHAGNLAVVVQNMQQMARGTPDFAPKLAADGIVDWVAAKGQYDKHLSGTVWECAFKEQYQPCLERALRQQGDLQLTV